MLEVRCGKCTRHGRLRVDKLIDKHGRDMSLPDLRVVLAADCEHNASAGLTDQCQVWQGWAVAYRRFSTDYVLHEDIARKAQRGVWRGKFQMPWDWRSASRNR